MWPAGHPSHSRAESFAEYVPFGQGLTASDGVGQKPPLMQGSAAALPPGHDVPVVGNIKSEVDIENEILYREDMNCYILTRLLSREDTRIPLDLQARTISKQCLCIEHESYRESFHTLLPTLRRALMQQCRQGTAA